MPVTDESLIINSVYALNGNAYNKAEVILPEKTKSYIYRISVQPKGAAGINSSLLKLLNEMGGSTVALTTSFANLAVKNNDNYAVDAFIFNNVVDAENFYAKSKDWSACKSLLGRSSSCFSTDECLSRKIYFGFRNNNLTQGLEVRLEVVAVVDTTLKSTYQYTYNIINETGREVKFSLSLDGKNWAPVTLRDSYKISPTFDQTEAFFRILTGLNKYVNYKISPDDRYKIYWNRVKGVWDLAKY